MRIRVAAIQMCSVPDREANLVVARGFIGEAAAAGADIVSLPENFSFLGSPHQKVDQGEYPDRSPTLDFLQSQARRHHVHLIGGSIPLRTSDPERVTNSCFAVDPDGNVVARYDKMHLFDVSIDVANTFRESDHVVPGDSVVTFQASGLTVGLSICFDLRFPELFRRLADRGAEMIFIPSAFTVPTGKAHWEVLLRARAIENQCYVVAPAQVGRHVQDRASYGKTTIIDPWGTLLATAPDRPSVVWADVDTDRITDVRTRLPALNKRRQDVFRR